MDDKEIMDMAIEIDENIDNENVDALLKNINRCELLLTDDKKNKAILYFYMANCYSSIDLIKKRGKYLSWSEYSNSKEILNLKKSINTAEFIDLSPLMKCKIYTNLANKLDSIGRHVAAIEYYDHALELIPRLIMASGNKSHCLYSYGAKLYDEHHADIFCRFSHKELINATTSGAVWDSGIDEKAKTLFKQRLDYMESMFNNEPDQYNYNDWPLGETSEEVKYRTWSMENKLFLNPLNDIMVLPIVTTDVLHLPNHNYHISETTARFSNYFNTIKQEYITSRYMLFKSIHEPNRHFIDDEVLLLNGFDGVYFGYKEELLKTSYRLTYSIFDKISYFINDYMCVGLNERDVSFNKIWGKYDKNEKRFVLREPFASSDNDILRALYFLSKELFDTMFVNFSDPDAKELDTIRHMIEHKFIAIERYGDEFVGLKNERYISCKDLQRKALKILKLSREAIIYLSLAVHYEEQYSDNDFAFSIQSVPLGEL